MFSSIKSVFVNPSTSLPPLLQLTAHTSVFLGRPPITLLCHEEIPAFSKQQYESIQESTNPTHPSNESLSDLTDLEERDDLEVTDDEANIIPKPTGEAGRPGRGGYNLEEALDWDKALYRRLKACGLCFIAALYV
jgi:hypothetical protein